MRDASQQHSATVSPQHLLKRLGEVSTEMVEDASGYFHGVASRKEARRATTGDTNSAVWQQRVTRQEVNEFVMLGYSVCQDMLRGEGYAAVLDKYPSVRSAYTKLIQLTKPQSTNSQVKWTWLLPPPALQACCIHAFVCCNLADILLNVLLCCRRYWICMQQHAPHTLSRLRYR
jgi:hypothetical protein